VLVKRKHDERHMATQPTRKRSETRARIVEAAAKLFRERGIDATGVDAVMAAAGLTHGGFYLHFASKEALAAEVCATQLAASAERWRGMEGPDAFARIVEHYLRPDAGCPLAVLGSELGRRAAPNSEVGQAARSMAATLSWLLGAADGRPTAEGWAALSTLVGAVVLSRVAGDPRDAADILAAARDHWLSRGEESR
jgi:TetR/AcrR family transcriptional repressor of nem operon